MSVPRRILLLTEESGVGGVQTTLQLLESALTPRGWQITRLPLRQGRPSLWACWQAARRAQVLVASNNFWPAYWAVALGWLSHRPTVVWVHGPLQAVLEQSGVSRLKSWWLGAVYRLVSQVVCASQTSRNSWVRWMAAQSPADAAHDGGSNVSVICNPAAPPAAGAATDQPDTYTHTNTAHAAVPGVIPLGFVGRLSPEKQPLQLIALLRHLPAACQLHVVGDGELMEAMHSTGRDLIAQGRLHLHGRQTVTEQTYRGWRATVLCSLYEGYPMTALESLACGVPCVSTPIPAMQEMLGPHAPAWLARDSSAQALADAVQACLAQDSGSRQKALHGLVAAHSPAAFAQAWDDVLQPLWARSGAGGRS